MPQKHAVVLHSGGMDSSICLALAARDWGPDAVLSLSFRYGQRHSEETERAQQIAAAFGVASEVLSIDFMQQITSSALLDPTGVVGPRTGTAPSEAMVVGRNGLLARIAAIHAHALGAAAVVLGVIGVEGENSGYPDCSRPYWDLSQELMRIDLGTPNFHFFTPLVAMTKHETYELALTLGVLPYLLETTITCYNRTDKEGCMRCPACQLRNDGLRTFLAAHPEVACSYKNKIFEGHPPCP